MYEYERRGTESCSSTKGNHCRWKSRIALQRNHFSLVLSKMERHTFYLLKYIILLKSSFGCTAIDGEGEICVHIFIF